MRKEQAGRINDRLNILLVVRWPVGGIRTFLKYTYSGMDPDRIRIVVVMSESSETEALKADLANVVSKWVVVDENAGFLTYMNTVRYERNIEKPSIIHAQGFTSAFLSSGFGGASARVVTVHDVLLESQLSGFKGVLKKFSLGLILSFFDIVHAVSEDSKDNLVEMLPFIGRRNIEVIRNGIDGSHFKYAEASDVKKINNIKENIVLVGFFGRFMGQKGFRYLVDAIESLNHNAKKGIEFQVLAVGGGGFIREEKAEIERRGLSGFFHFQPFSDNIGGLIKGCDLVAMPSLWEACPLLPMEVLCAGVPLVATECIGLREVVKGTPAVLVKPGDSPSLAEGILGASETPKKVFEDYVPEACERFSIEKTRSGVWAMYQRISGK